MTAELRLLRVRFAAIDEDIDRAEDRQDDGTVKMVGQVFNNGSLPTSTGKYFAVHPVTVSGTEGEGRIGSFAVNTTVTQYFLVLGSRTPLVGENLIGELINGRWVTGGGGQVTLVPAILTFKAFDSRGTSYGAPGVTSVSLRDAGGVLYNVELNQNIDNSDTGGITLRSKSGTCTFFANAFGFQQYNGSFEWVNGQNQTVVFYMVHV